jgi:hypothetical protein
MLFKLAQPEYFRNSNEEENAAFSYFDAAEKTKCDLLIALSKCRSFIFLIFFWAKYLNMCQVLVNVHRTSIHHRQ